MYTHTTLSLTQLTHTQPLTHTTHPYSVSFCEAPNSIYWFHTRRIPTRISIVQKELIVVVISWSLPKPPAPLRGRKHIRGIQRWPSDKYYVIPQKLSYCNIILIFRCDIFSGLFLSLWSRESDVPRWFRCRAASLGAAVYYRGRLCSGRQVKAPLPRLLDCIWRGSSSVCTLWASGCCTLKQTQLLGTLPDS